jgi:hypothetical protein
MRDLTGKPGPTFPDRASQNLEYWCVMTLLRIVIPRRLFCLKHDLRANAYRVCPEGKPVPLFRIMLRGRFPPKRKPGQKDRAIPYALRRNIFRKRQKTMVCLAFG